MRKLKFIGLLTIIALAFGITFAACSGGSDDTGNPNDDLIILGMINGKDVEVTISTSSKATITPVTGQHYVIRFVETGEIISKGTIEYNDPNIVFIPDDGSAHFYGYYSAGTFEISEFPYEGEKHKIGGGNPSTTTPKASYSLVASTSATYAPVSFTLTTKGKAVIHDGNYDYQAKIGDVTISSGTATVNNNVFTFLASNNDAFDYDATTGTVNGSITLTPAKIAELEDAAGGISLSLPTTLSLSSFTEVERGSSNYWNGTWIREDDGGTQLPQKLTFSGANYSYFDGYNTESGTFTYNDPSTAAAPGTDRVFIFYRPGNQLAVYLFEGMADDPIVTDNFIELYNWMIDPMEIAISPYWEPYIGWTTAPNIPNFGDADYADYLIARLEWPRAFHKQP